MTATMTPPAPVEKRPMRKYRLIGGGTHNEALYDENGHIRHDRQGNILSEDYRVGAIIESPVDLCEKHNVRGLPRRFEKVGEETTPNQLPHETAEQYAQRLEKLLAKAKETVQAERQQRDAVASGELSAMTFEQLQRIAADEEIDIADCGDKEAVIGRIRSALGKDKVPPKQPQQQQPAKGGPVKPAGK